MELLSNTLVLICCAPCCVALVEQIARAGTDATLFFYNPNIYPQTEYEKRKSEVLRIAKLYGVKVIDADYRPEEYDKAVKGLESCPERGERCSACFYLRLAETARVARENGFANFTSTLGFSRHKNLAQVHAAGEKAAANYEIPYLAMDFRAGDAQLRAAELAKEHNIYRQTYCGCKFSLEYKKQKL
ncbi:MAG: epoxyqueuosine reductase QueH [Rickettsiales bacterium]|nr:epoxyqueuosine reductase QueH [Rickettsiales bacterium]